MRSLQNLFWGYGAGSLDSRSRNLARDVDAPSRMSGTRRPHRAPYEMLPKSLSSAMLIQLLFVILR